jgi:hypothetical protein
MLILSILYYLWVRFTGPEYNVSGSFWLCSALLSSLTLRILAFFARQFLQQGMLNIVNRFSPSINAMDLQQGAQSALSSSATLGFD